MSYSCPPFQPNSSRRPPPPPAPPYSTGGGDHRQIPTKQREFAMTTIHQQQHCYQYQHDEQQQQQQQQSLGREGSCGEMVSEDVNGKSDYFDNNNKRRCDDMDNVFMARLRHNEFLLQLSEPECCEEDDPVNQQIPVYQFHQQLQQQYNYHQQQLQQYQLQRQQYEQQQQQQAQRRQYQQQLQHSYYSRFNQHQKAVPAIIPRQQPAEQVLPMEDEDKSPVNSKRKGSSTSALYSHLTSLTSISELLKVLELGPRQENRPNNVHCDLAKTYMSRSKAFLDPFLDEQEFAIAREEAEKLYKSVRVEQGIRNKCRIVWKDLIQPCIDVIGDGFQRVALGGSVNSLTAETARDYLALLYLLYMLPEEEAAFVLSALWMTAAIGEHDPNMLHFPGLQ
eukprot:TRINITY_DN5272_c0_g1_i3.p1 TRINITY_DN5272_c0_g1~~TRINITY_DN5272_c0_g1_i3.p1  ORF type:complete len:393 (+),score=68.41 TRINITY_DN5272_c0_g1_i3:104-1282(+)